MRGSSSFDGATRAWRDAHTAIDGMLAVVRAHLGLDVAFVSRFTDGRRVFTHVGADATPPVRPGDGDPLEDTYCAMIADGRLRALTADVGADPRLRAMPVTRRMGIKTYAGVPIRLPDGRVYGTLCAFGSETRVLQPEDADALRLAAALIANRLAAEGSPEELLGSVAFPAGADDGDHRVGRLLAQSIHDLHQGGVVGHEVLPELHLSDGRVELPGHDGEWMWQSVALQFQTVRRTLRTLGQAGGTQFVAVNLSDRALMTDALGDLLGSTDTTRLVVEVSDHEDHRYGSHLVSRLEELRSMGARVALDDVGCGYTGLHRLLQLSPDIIKLDRTLVDGLATDARRRSMVGEVVAFADATGGLVAAEGLEHQADIDTARELGVAWGQGPALSWPRDL